MWAEERNGDRGEEAVLLLKRIEKATIGCQYILTPCSAEPTGSADPVTTCSRDDVHLAVDDP